MEIYFLREIEFFSGVEKERGGKKLHFLLVTLWECIYLCDGGSLRDKWLPREKTTPGKPILHLVVSMPC
jgi:hypothetical protein